MQRFVWVLCVGLLFASHGFSEIAVRSLKWSDLRPANTPRDMKSMLPIHNFSDEQGPAAKQGSTDAPVVKALDGKRVRIPGYVVPIVMDDKYQITEFLLVPYLGACIHVPPPPSNQIVYVKSKVAINYSDIDDPFWVEGLLHVTPTSSELAESGYLLEGKSLTPYIPEWN